MHKTHILDQKNNEFFFLPTYLPFFFLDRYRKQTINFLGLNPSNAEATFVQSSRTQRFLKTIQTLSCWYSLESSRGVLSDEHPFARVSIIVQGFLHYFVLAKLATTFIRVNRANMSMPEPSFLRPTKHLPCVQGVRGVLLTLMLLVANRADTE